MVAGRAHAPIFLSHVNYAIHERLERTFKLFRVWRTVVDDDHFVVTECLREDRLQGLADVRRDFISRHHNANAGPGIHVESLLGFSENRSRRNASNKNIESSTFFPVGSEGYEAAVSGDSRLGHCPVARRVGFLVDSRSRVTNSANTPTPIQRHL